MRIAVISAVYPPHAVGGAEISAYNIATALARNGDDLSVITMAEADEREVWGERNDQGVKEYRLHFPRARTVYSAHANPLGRWGWKLWHLQDFLDFRPLSKIRKVLDEINPESVNIHLLDGMGFNLIPELNRRKISVSFFLHDHSLICSLSTMFKNGRECTTLCTKCWAVSRLKNAYLSNLKGLFFVSPSESHWQVIEKHLPIASKTPHLIMRGILDEFSLSRPPCKPVAALGTETLKILYAGRIHPTKGVDILLQALAPLATEFNFHLTILGRGEQEEELKKQYGNEPWVTFGGFVAREDVMRSIATHHLVCTPSLWAEVYGRVTAQALAMGTPVFGSNKGGTVELIRHEETGLILPAGDVAAWREAFRRVLKEPQLLGVWRQNALARAGEFDTDTIVNSFVNFVRGVNRKFRPAG